LKNPPGEDTGPTEFRDFLENHVGRVPPRGVPSIFQRAVSNRPSRNRPIGMRRPALQRFNASMLQRKWTR
jgi:hypothetical protein